MGYLDGTNVAPDQKIPASSAAGASLIDNPDYTSWYNKDEQVLSTLLSSLSVEILRDVVSAKTSKDVWDSLQKRFSSSTHTRTVQLHVELATAQKNNLSAADYFGKIKNLATEMAMAHGILRDDEILTYLLAGLPAEYDPYVTSMMTKDSITLDDAYAHLVAFEAHQLKHQTALQLNYAGRGGQSRGRGHSYRGHACSRGGAPPHSNGDRRGPSSCPPCQICGKVGHTGIRCWYRMDDSYSEDPPSAAMAATSSKVDVDWYTDIGAIDHITSDLDHLALSERYHGNNQVQVGNGSGLRIMHIGHSSINTVDRPLALHNILHIPAVAKPLLSIHKFSRDNDVFFEYHHWHFSIKDR
jgi:hypothetical protein